MGRVLQLVSHFFFLGLGDVADEPGETHRDEEWLHEKDPLVHLHPDRNVLQYCIFGGFFVSEFEDQQVEVAVEEVTQADENVHDEKNDGADHDGPFGCTALGKHHVENDASHF